MSIPKNNFSVRPASTEIKQFIDKLDKSSKSGATTQIHAEKNTEGKIIFSRASANNINAGTLSDHLKHSTQRQVARDEIKRMLKDSGIEITDNIKKAMPSFKRAGDANSLQIFLQEAVTERDNLIKLTNEVKAGFKDELKETKFRSSQVATFFRNTTETTKALAKMFEAEIKPISNSSAKIASDATLRSLSKNKDPDLAMRSGYQAFLGSLSSIILPDSFKALCIDMAKEINNSAVEAIQMEPGRAKEIKEVAESLKGMIVAIVFLRVFTPQVTVSLSLNNKQMEDSAEKLGVKLNGTSKLQRLTVPFLSLINNAQDMAKVTGKDVAIYDDHPKFKNFVIDKNLNNLDNFTAYHELNAQIQAENSLSDN